MSPKQPSTHFQPRLRARRGVRGQCRRHAAQDSSVMPGTILIADSQESQKNPPASVRNTDGPRALPSSAAAPSDLESILRTSPSDDEGETSPEIPETPPEHQLAAHDLFQKISGGGIRAATVSGQWDRHGENIYDICICVVEGAPILDDPAVKDALERFKHGRDVASQSELVGTATPDVEIQTTKKRRKKQEGRQGTIDAMDKPMASNGLLSRPQTQSRIQRRLRRRVSPQSMASPNRGASVGGGGTQQNNFS